VTHREKCAQEREKSKKRHRKARPTEVTLREYDMSRAEKQPGRMSDRAHHVAHSQPAPRCAHSRHADVPIGSVPTCAMTSLARTQQRGKRIKVAAQLGKKRGRRHQLPPVHIPLYYPPKVVAPARAPPTRRRKKGEEREDGHARRRMTSNLV